MLVVLKLFPINTDLKSLNLCFPFLHTHKMINTPGMAGIYEADFLQICLIYLDSGV